jgi:hypothetical protein
MNLNMTEEERLQALQQIQQNMEVFEAMDVKRVGKDFRILFREVVYQENKIDWIDGDRIFFSVDSPDFDDDEDNDNKFTLEDLPRLIESMKSEFPFSKQCLFIYNLEVPAGIFRSTIYAKTEQDLKRVVAFLTKFPDRLCGEFQTKVADVSATSYEDLKEWLIE